MKLEVTDIDFSYNGRPVLSEVSFSLDRGQVLCVLGVNGAGKSTLLKCLNRILKPQRGSVLVDGEDLLLMNRNKAARRIGYAPQRHPETHLTVFEAVLMGRKPHMRWSMGKDDYATAERALRQMGLESMAMRPVSRLSGGEQQKVVIARALAQMPEVLLLDEPTSNLDLKSGLELVGLIRRIVESQGLSAVVAIHDLNIALRLADGFLFLMDRGVHSVTTKEGLTPGTIRRVYGIDATLSEVEGHTVVVPL